MGTSITEACKIPENQQVRTSGNMSGQHEPVVRLEVRELWPLIELFVNC